MSFRDIPLPPNWEEAVDAKTGKPYYIGTLCFISPSDTLSILLYAILYSPQSSFETFLRYFLYQFEVATIDSSIRP